MKRPFLVALILVVVLAAAFAVFRNRPAGDRSAEAQALAEAFGGQLQKVSVLAPQDTVRSDFEAFYGPYVSAELLTSWKAEPEQAPGRQTSTPYPDRIEVQSVSKGGDGSYRVEGAVVEAAQGQDVLRYPVVVTVAEREGKLVIVGYERAYDF